MEELKTVASLRAVLLIRKSKAGPPAKLEEDGVWAQDSDWREDTERIREAEAIIAKQGAPMSAFWFRDYEKRQKWYWDEFYKRNGDRFFRDRHYVDTVFDAALSGLQDGETLVELGCGVGNGVLPLLDSLPSKIRLRCLDFAPEAVAILRRRPEFDPATCSAEVCDLVADPLGPDGSARVVTCFFVLSALSPPAMPAVAAKIASLLHPTNGVLCVRDYGLYDQAQLRFKKGRKLAHNFYVKQDGTRCYYFHVRDLDALFLPLGLIPANRGAAFVNQRHLNRATNSLRRRVFVEAIYHRKHSLSSSTPPPSSSFFPPDTPRHHH